MTATAADARAWLAEIPELCALLPDAAVTRAAIEGPRPAPSSKPPLKLDVLDLTDCRHKSSWLDARTLLDPDRQGVLPYLDSWVRDLEATAYDGDPVYGIDPHDLHAYAPEHPTVTNLCDWLTAEVEWAETLPQWPELADGIRHLRARLRDATRDVRDVEERPVPCTRCGNPLARVEGEKPQWECTGCGHLVTVQAVTLTEAARRFKIPRETLVRWSKRSALLSPVTDTPGRVVYDLAQLSSLVAENRTRKVLDNGA